MTPAGTSPRVLLAIGSRLLVRLVRLLPEFALVVGVYAAYDWVRDAVHGQVNAAVQRGLALLHDETLLHLDPEHALNNFVASHPLVAKAFNYYYASGHFVITIAVLVLLYWRAPRIARRYAGAWYAMNLLGLLGFWLFALAPPRLLPHREFVDTVVMFHTAMGWGSPAVQAASNQYAAMPSLHVGWALWCTATVWAMTQRRWLRLLAASYPVITTIVVLGTANHYLADTVAGVLVCAAGFGVVSLAAAVPRRAAERLRPVLARETLPLGALRRTPAPPAPAVLVLPEPGRDVQRSAAAGPPARGGGPGGTGAGAPGPPPEASGGLPSAPGVRASAPS